MEHTDSGVRWSGRMGLRVEVVCYQPEEVVQCWIAGLVVANIVGPVVQEHICWTEAARMVEHCREIARVG